VLEPLTVSLVTERRTTPPWGAAGGGPGATGENRLLPGGDVLRLRTPAAAATALRRADRAARTVRDPLDVAA